MLQVFQCLIIDGENAGQEALRDAQPFVITDDEFTDFLKRHSHVTCLVPESNEAVSHEPFINTFPLQIH